MTVPASAKRTRRWLAAASMALFIVLLLPAGASALKFKIVNESNRAPEDVYVTVEATGGYDVPGMTNNTPVKLSEIPGEELTINELVSGRVYISYGAGVTSSVSFDSPTRFDWAELTVTPNSADVANLTAVDQFGIGMRLDTYKAGMGHLETVGDANSATIFSALQQIPGGPEATVRDSEGAILRVLSPVHTSAYPDLGDYVRSMSGQTVTLHTAYYGTPFTTSVYSGSFAADGSITLKGTTNPPGIAPPSISFGGTELIEDIFTGAGTPNDAEGAIRRDLLAGFSTGFWDGKYGDDALSFCSNPITTGQGSWCPNGFNQPAFGDARSSLSSFPTCEQYAAVINQYTDVYGNPYSDAAKKVTVSLDQPVDSGEVETLQLTILPDSGNAEPATGGNSNCGAAASGGPGSGSGSAGGPAASPAKSAAPASAASFQFVKRAEVHNGSARVARLSCTSTCGKVRAIAKKGRKVVGRAKFKAASAKPWVALRLTKAGKAMLADSGQLKVSLGIWIEPAGQPATHTQRSLVLHQG